LKVGKTSSIVLKDEVTFATLCSSLLDALKGCLKEKRCLIITALSLSTEVSPHK
jgi:hypothetical protein